jgi:hypothetical protein
MLMSALARVVCNKVFQPYLGKHLSGMPKQLRLAQTGFRSAPQRLKSAPQGLKSAQVGLKSAQNRQLGTDIPNVFNADTKVRRLETVFCMSPAILVSNIPKALLVG